MAGGGKTTRRARPRARSRAIAHPFMMNWLDSKWSILVLRELFGGDRRTGELQAALAGISTKTLTKELKKLAAHGLIERRA